MGKVVKKVAELRRDVDRLSYLDPHDRKPFELLLDCLDPQADLRPVWWRDLLMVCFGRLEEGRLTDSEVATLRPIVRFAARHQPA